MVEQWIVAVDQTYYPMVGTFATEAEARKAYDDYRADDYYLSHTAIYIGRIDKATHKRQTDMGWQPVIDGDPERDGYCQFCRCQHLPEGEWTP